MRDFSFDAIDAIFFLSDLHHYDFRGLTNNRPYSRYPPSLHARKDWWDKSNVRWFRRRQTSVKIYRGIQEIAVDFVYSRQKMKKFWSLRRCFQIIGVPDHFFSFGCGSNGRCPHTSNDDVKLVEARTVHFSGLKLSSPFEKINKRPRLLVLAYFITCLPPPHDITFTPSILKRVQKWRISWIRPCLPHDEK